jgi:hypothetical protein
MFFCGASTILINRDKPFGYTYYILEKFQLDSGCVFSSPWIFNMTVLAFLYPSAFFSRRRIALSGLAWFLVSFSYYGVLMLSNALGGPARHGDGSILEIITEGFAWEIPGILAAALAVERVGRRPTVVVCLLQGTVTLAAASISASEVQRWLAVASRFGLAGAWAALYLQTFELFELFLPLVQYQGLAAANLFAKMGAIVSPVLALLAAREFGGKLFIPLIVCAGSSLTAAATAALLPETLGVLQQADDSQEMVFEASASSAKQRRPWMASLRLAFRSGAQAPPRSPLVERSGRGSAQ